MFEDIDGMVTPDLIPKRRKRKRDSPRIVFKTSEDRKRLLLVYAPDGGVDFIDNRFSSEGDESVLTVKQIFDFQKADVVDLHSTDVNSRTFVFGEVDNDLPDYWRVVHRKLGIEHDLLISIDVMPELEWFTPLYIYDYGNVTVFDKIDKLIQEDIIIGGAHERAISLEAWENIQLRFPTKTETAHYWNGRIEALIRDYFTILPESEKKLEKYLVQREKKLHLSRGDSNSRKQFDVALADYEVQKYSCLLNRLKELLADDSVSEAEWEKEILKFILLIYPKYVAVLNQVSIKEQITNQNGEQKSRKFDIVLVDADGHIDLIEIKKPSAGSVFRDSTDHDNAVPSLMLVKTIMQAEKYLLYLQKGGYQLEKKLNEAYGDRLPPGLKIKVVNPRAMVVAGRRDFDSRFDTDYEVIRRKYSNIIDIVTYDDLLDYFKNIIARLQRS